MERISDLFDEIATEIALDYSKIYSTNGRLFIKMFESSEPVRWCSLVAVKYFEKNGLLEDDEKIREFSKGRELLRKTLNMIKTITE